MKFIKILVWLQFFCLLGLTLNHLFRGLNALPLVILLIPSMCITILEG